MAEGKIRPNHKGHWVVETIQDGVESRAPEIIFVTPVAHDIELAKSELKEDMNQRVNSSLKVNKRGSNLDIYSSKKKARLSIDVFNTNGYQQTQ